MPAARNEVSARLRRIEGQVAGLRRMHEEDRYCIDVLDQISAVRAALSGLAPGDPRSPRGDLRPAGRRRRRGPGAGG